MDTSTDVMGAVNDAVKRAKNIIEDITSNSESHNQTITGIIEQITNELKNFDNCIEKINQIKKENEELSNKIETMRENQMKELNDLKTQNEGEKSSALKKHIEDSMKNVEEIINDLNTLKSKMDSNRGNQITKLTQNVESIREKISILCKSAQKEQVEQLNEEPQMDNPGSDSPDSEEPTRSERVDMFDVLTKKLYDFDIKSADATKVKNEMITPLTQAFADIDQSKINLLNKIQNVLAFFTNIYKHKQSAGMFQNKYNEIKKELAEVLNIVVNVTMKNNDGISIKKYWSEKIDEERLNIRNISDEYGDNNKYGITMNEFISGHYFKTPTYFDKSAKRGNPGSKMPSGKPLYGGFRYGTDLERILRNSPLRSLNNKSPSKNITLKSKSRTKTRSLNATRKSSRIKVIKKSKKKKPTKKKKKQMKKKNKPTKKKKKSAKKKKSKSLKKRK